MEKSKCFYTATRVTENFKKQYYTNHFHIIRVTLIVKFNFLLGVTVPNTLLEKGKPIFFFFEI